MALTAQFSAGEKPTAAKLNASSIPVVSATSDIVSPFSGQLIFNTSDAQLHRYTGTVWTVVTGVIGGKRFTTGAALATTSGTVEKLSTVETGSLPMIGGLLYEVECAVSFQNSVNNDQYLFQIKEGSLVGAGLCAFVTPSLGAGVPLWTFIKVYYRNASTASRNFVVTVQRISGTGTCQINASALGSTYAIIRPSTSTTVVDV